MPSSLVSFPVFNCYNQKPFIVQLKHIILLASAFHPEPMTPLESLLSRASPFLSFLSNISYSNKILFLPLYIIPWVKSEFSSSTASLKKPTYLAPYYISLLSWLHPHKTILNDWKIRLMKAGPQTGEHRKSKRFKLWWHTETHCITPPNILTYTFTCVYLKQVSRNNIYPS